MGLSRISTLQSDGPWLGLPVGLQPDLPHDIHALLLLPVVVESTECIPPLDF